MRQEDFTTQIADWKANQATSKISEAYQAELQVQGGYVTVDYIEDWTSEIKKNSRKSSLLRTKETTTATT